MLRRFLNVVLAVCCVESNAKNVTSLKTFSPTTVLNVVSTYCAVVAILCVVTKALVRSDAIRLGKNDVVTREKYVSTFS